MRLVIDDDDDIEQACQAKSKNNLKKVNLYRALLCPVSKAPMTV